MPQDPAMRQVTHLPHLLVGQDNQKLNIGTKKVDRRDGIIRGSLPRVGPGMTDKAGSLRRGGPSTELNHPQARKLAAKEELERQRRKANPQGLGRHGNSKSTSSRGGASGNLTARGVANQARGRLQRAGSARSSYSCSSRATSTRSRGYHRYQDMEQDVSGMRGDSRVGKLLNEFAGKDDWVSKTVLKHQMATILQANVRGWLARVKWHRDKLQVVKALQEKLQAAATLAERRARLRRTLEARNAMTLSKQKKQASSVIATMFGSRLSARVSGSQRVPISLWAKLQKNSDIAVHDLNEEMDNLENLEANGSDSDFSDLEMEDITAVKIRARTPPWQRVEESRWQGQYNKLTQPRSNGSLDVLWDLDASLERLGGARARRLAREEAAGETIQKVLGVGEEKPVSVFDSSLPLPTELISTLLYPKYAARFARMGLLEKGHVLEPVDESILRPTVVEAAPAPPAVTEQEVEIPDDPPQLTLPSKPKSQGKA